MVPAHPAPPSKALPPSIAAAAPKATPKPAAVPACIVVQCPKCATSLQVAAKVTRVQCVKCRATITVVRPGTSPVQGKPLGFLAYYSRHFAATRGPAAAGICCGLLAIPAVSLLKPVLGFRGMCLALTGVLALAAISGILHMLARAVAYYSGGQHTVSDKSWSVTAPIMYGGLMFLLPTVPWVAAEYFTPPHGLLANLLPRFRSEQARWFHLPPDAQQPANAAPASAARPVVDLLEKIDLSRDTVDGKWSKEKGSLVNSGDEKSCFLSIPYSLPEDFTLLATVERKSGARPFGLGLAIGSAACVLHLDSHGGRTCDIALVNGIPLVKPCEENVLAPGKQHTVACTVHKKSNGEVSIAAAVDEKTVFEWRGTSGQLSLPPTHRMARTEGPRFPWLEVHGSAFAVSKLELRCIGAEKTEPSDGTVALFDGKTLNGWHFRREGGSDVWSVRDSELVCTPQSQSKGQNLVTDELFRDFDLQLDFLIEEAGNSGVYLRGLYEVQLCDDNAKLLPPEARCGAIYRQIPPSEPAYLGPGRWNTLRVKMVGSRVSVIMNGKQIVDVAEVRGPTDNEQTLDIKEGEAGPIMLQCMPGGAVRFRNLSIRTIEDRANLRPDVPVTPPPLRQPAKPKHAKRRKGVQ